MKSLNFVNHYVILNHPEESRAPIGKYLSGSNNQLSRNRYDCDYEFDLKNSVLQISGDNENTIDFVMKELLIALEMSQSNKIGFRAYLSHHIDNTKSPTQGNVSLPSDSRVATSTNKTTLESLIDNAVILPVESKELFQSSKEFERAGYFRVAYFLRYSSLESFSRFIIEKILIKEIMDRNGKFHDIDKYLTQINFNKSVKVDLSNYESNGVLREIRNDIGHSKFLVSSAELENGLKNLNEDIEVIYRSYRTEVANHIGRPFT